MLIQISFPQRCATRGVLGRGTELFLFAHELLLFAQRLLLFAEELFLFAQKLLLFEEELFLFAQKLLLFEEELFLFAQRLLLFEEELLMRAHGPLPPVADIPRVTTRNNLPHITGWIWVDRLYRVPDVCRRLRRAFAVITQRRRRRVQQRELEDGRLKARRQSEKR